MLAGLAAPDGGQRVPVVRRSDGDGVDVLVFEDLADVLLYLRRLLLAFVDALQGIGNDVLIRINEIGNLDVLKPGEALDVSLAAALDTHDGEDDFFARLVGGAGGIEGGERRSGGGTLEEAATIDDSHARPPKKVG